MGEDTARGAAPITTDPDQLPSGRGPTILVVDDDPLVRDALIEALTLAAFDVIAAASGKVALRLVAEGRVQPAVLVTGIDLPVMNGVEIAARLLALRPAIRVVMITADPERAASARRHPSIVDRVLMKPIRVAEVVDAVQAATGREAAR